MLTSNQQRRIDAANLRFDLDIFLEPRDPEQSVDDYRLDCFRRFTPVIRRIARGDRELEAMLRERLDTMISDWCSTEFVLDVPKRFPRTIEPSEGGPRSRFSFRIFVISSLIALAVLYRCSESGDDGAGAQGGRISVEGP